jgi:nucleoside-diphosphate-sugar epimerase
MPVSALLTGASGFVGKALLTKLLSTGRRVKACYRALPTVLPEGAECFEIPNLTSEYELNWRDALVGVETVVHAAARVHVMRDQSVDPLQEFRLINVEGTLNLARWAAEAGVQRFVFISSIKAMGEQTELGNPFFADSPCAPVDPYGISKWEAEKGLLKLAHETGMEVVVIRPPLVYGPGVKANFASMMGWVLRGIPLPLGRVTQNRRSFVSLGNLVDLIVVCINHSAAANQIFLVSDGEDLSTAELIRRMGQAFGRSVMLINCPTRYLKWTFRVMRKTKFYDRICGNLQVDIRKNRDLLSWTPPVTVDEGLMLAAVDRR